jgi:uncharacterized membrane protein
MLVHNYGEQQSGGQMAPTPILVLHVSGGTIGLLSGAVSLTFRKGSRPHRVAGTVFFISMLVAAAAGTYLGYRNTEMDNVFGGVLVLYLLATAWMTARRRDGETGIFDWVAFVVALAIGAISVTYAVEAAYSPSSTKAGLPPSGYAFPIAVALISLAHVFCTFHCDGIHFPGTPAAIPGFIYQNTRTLSPRNPSIVVNGFLARSGLVHQGIQNRLITKIGCQRRESNPQPPTWQAQPESLILSSLVVLSRAELL